MENNLPQNFTNLLLALQYRKTYHRALSSCQGKYNLKQANIQELSPFKALELYRTVVKKFYMNRTKIIQGSWFQNQLRVYLWLLVGYLFIYKKSIQQMNQDDWAYFSPIFHQRHPISFQFQALSLIPTSKTSKWNSDQMDLLQTIIKQKKFKNKWNSIARQLFIRSQKNFFRTPKQCRQRWLNYLDPVKKKTGWENSEDLILLKTILQIGKRWSTVVRTLKGTRTQHMVKNRFKSIVANQMKKYPKMTEEQTIKKLINQLQTQVQHNNERNGSNSIAKINYQQISTQNLGGKQELLPKTNSQYIESMSNIMSFVRNGSPAFYIPNGMFSGVKMMSFSTSGLETYPFNKNCFSVIPNGNDMNFTGGDQNEFLMSHEQLENYMIIDGNQKQSLMKEEQMQDKVNQMNQNHQYMQKQQKINYFSQQFHDCFQ